MIVPGYVYFKKVKSRDLGLIIVMGISGVLDPPSTSSVFGIILPHSLENNL